MPKTLLITGASTGFGRDMAETLSQAGHRVFASMPDPSGRNRERANALWAQGMDVVSLDVTDDESVGRAIRTVLGKAPKLDALINNAEIVAAGLTEAFMPTQFQAVLDTNVIGLLRTARAVLPGMRGAGDGLIVNVGSIMGRLTFPFFGLYGASKFAVEALTECLRYEVSPFGVDVVLVQPGVYPTSICAGFLPPDDKALEASYGSVNRLPGALLHRLSAPVFGESGPDPHEVSLAVAKLIATEAGARPARTVVGSPCGADRVNDATAPVQQRLMESTGLSYLARLGRHEGGAPPRSGRSPDD